MWLMEPGDRSDSWEGSFHFSVSLSGLFVCPKLSLATSVAAHTQAAFRVVSQARLNGVISAHINNVTKLIWRAGACVVSERAN